MARYKTWKKYKMSKRQHPCNHPRSTALLRAQIRYAIEESRWGLLDGSEWDDYWDNVEVDEIAEEYEYQC